MIQRVGRIRALGATGHAGGQRGQGLVEFALVLPILLLLVLGMIEFGFAFDHHLTLHYATREGARTGAALGNGDGPPGCNTVDAQIVAAVQRALFASGTPVVATNVSQIRIYKATTSGGEIAGSVNVWAYAPDAGPVVDGQALDFRPISTAWSACTRRNESPADSIGVSVGYTYRFSTPLAGPLFLVGAGTLGMNDRTVMQLNPGDL